MIIVEKDTNIVRYVGDLTLTEEGLFGPFFNNASVTSNDFESIEVPFPADFKIGHYTYTALGGWERTPLGISERQEALTDKIKSEYLTHPPVEVNGILWTGGDGSASAISGAVTLAQNKGETSVTLWDVDNVNHANISFEDALLIAATIATEYRTRMYERNTRIAEIGV
jgi:hypothetical protein